MQSLTNLFLRYSKDSNKKTSYSLESQNHYQIHYLLKLTQIFTFTSIKCLATPLISVGPLKIQSNTPSILEKLMILRKCQASKLTLFPNTETYPAPKTNHYLTIQSHHNQKSSLLVHVNLKQVMRQLTHESHLSSRILRRESKREPWEFILYESHEQLVSKQLE